MVTLGVRWLESVGSETIGKLGRTYSHSHSLNNSDNVQFPVRSN